MRKYSLLLAVMLAASFSTGADAAKKKAGKAPSDPVYEWNVKNVPPAPQASTGAATPAKAAKKSSKKKAKKA